MRRLNYQEAIQESVASLVKLEKSQQAARLRDRVRMLRYLKEGRAVNQQEAGELVGLCRRQIQKQYTTYGLESLIAINYKGS